jgi:hypothetical protein
MAEPEKRLGDLIDDYCPRCKLLLNHAIASFVGTEVVKVICQTCLSEHPFLHAESPKKKKPAGGPAGLFDLVLTKVAGGAAGAPPAEAADQETPPAEKKKRSPTARYISRHKTKPARKGS